MFSLRKQSKTLNIKIEKTRQLHRAGIMVVSYRVWRVQGDYD